MLGPIFSFELLTASRRTRYFVVRGLYGAILAAALFLVWMSVFHGRSWSGQQSNAIALSARFMAGFFQTFSVMQLLAAVVLGPAVAAGTIAGERERRTIEYLFTANLGNAEIVLSKLAARFLQIMLILLAGLPILAVAMLQGGIAPEALLAVYVVTFSTVVCVATLSIAVSVWSARARDAVIRAYLVILVLLIVPMIVAAFTLSGTLSFSWLDVLMDYAIDPLLASNPFWKLSDIISGTSGTAISTGWSAVEVLVRNQMIFALVCAVYATLAVRRVHVRQMGRAKANHKWLILPRLRPSLGNKPMLWKELFAGEASSRLGAIGRIAICLLAASVLIPLGWQFIETLDNSSTGRNAQGILHPVSQYLIMTAMLGSAVSCGIFILIGARAACSITSEKERDCWQSLISTPLTGMEIVQAKILGSIYALRYLFGVLFIMWSMVVILSPGFVFIVPVLLFTLLVISIAMASLGTLFSLRMKSSLWAMAATLGISFFVGGGYLFCCMPVMIAGGGRGGEEIMLAPLIPFLMAAPVVFYAEGVSHGAGGALAANVFGVIGYTVTAIVLYASAIGSFDLFSGRSENTTSSAHLWQEHSTGAGKSPFVNSDSRDASGDITMDDVLDMIQATRDRQPSQFPHPHEQHSGLTEDASPK
ncbi:MAG: ABC transporter permease subunit [Pirellulales bacterium]|nr:ABC transporter permease subunit [Pirellulales bacterium]